MIAHHHHASMTARLLAVLGVALAFVLILASSAANSASADQSQWIRTQPHWWDQQGGWRNDSRWHKRWNHRRHFNSSRSAVIIGGSGVVFSSPGIIVTNPGFVVRQPGIIVAQPSFIVRHPNFVFQRPGFVAKQKQFIKRHPSLHLGQPWRHKSWEPRSWKHKNWRHPPMGMN